MQKIRNKKGYSAAVAVLLLTKTPPQKDEHQRMTPSARNSKALLVKEGAQVVVKFEKIDNPQRKKKAFVCGESAFFFFYFCPSFTPCNCPHEMSIKKKWRKTSIHKENGGEEKYSASKKPKNVFFFLPEWRERGGLPFASLLR